VLLRATVSDSSLIASFNDTAPGDVRNATVTFSEGTTVLCTANLPVALLGTDPTLGSASCTKTLGVGAHTINISVDGYYVGTAEGLVEVATPDGSFITGGAWRTASASFGQYAATAGGREQFAFNVKYNKNNTNIQGHANVIFVSGGETYQILSNALDSLGTALKTPTGGACTGVPSATCWGIASFRAKANLTDITNPLNPISIASNLSLQLTLTDKGATGDTIGAALYRGNTLLFASEWDGSKTVEGTISGGNLSVH